MLVGNQHFSWVWERPQLLTQQESSTAGAASLLVWLGKSSLAGGEKKKKKTIQQKFGMLPVSFTCHVVNLCSADGIAAPIMIKHFWCYLVVWFRAPVMWWTWNQTPRIPPSSHLKRCHVLLSIFTLFFFPFFWLFFYCPCSSSAAPSLHVFCALPFLLCGCCCGGSVGSTTKPQDAHADSLRTAFN